MEGNMLATVMWKHTNAHGMPEIKNSLQLLQGLSSKVSQLRGHVQADPLLAAAKISPSEALAIGQEADSAASVAADKILETGCPACEAKDFSEPCPRGWRGDSADGMCTAPPGYAGACETALSFVAASAEKKAEVELICGVCWPC